jgi:ABC-type amino acid transport substrate-binding protein
MTATLRKLVPLAGLMLLVPVCASGASADEPMRYVYDSPESALDRRYEYHWEILKTALERTKDKYGPYVMEPSVPMPEKRQASELKAASGKITVMYLGTKPDFERTLVPVRIPVDKNLGGYCVFLIRKADRERFKSVQSLDDLQKFRYGLGLGWIDVEILRLNHFKVVTGSSYDGLFSMLVNRRFDVFLRAAVEVLDEYEQRKAAMPDLYVEETICLYYPLPMYFWFSKNAEGQRLAARAREGMFSMIEDGTYDRIFFKYQQPKIDRLDLKHRKIFRIDNPFLVPETPFSDKRLWYDPTGSK